MAAGLHTAKDAWKQTICASMCSNEELRAALTASLESYKMLPDRECNYFPYKMEGSRPTSIFAFPGSHNVQDWVSNFELSNVFPLKSPSCSPILLVYVAMFTRVLPGAWGLLSERVGLWVRLTQH